MTMYRHTRSLFPARTIALAAFALSVFASAAEAVGNGIRGGLLYDKWWDVKGLPAPTGSHPLYPAAGNYQGADSYRCKECHGWDYKGVNGVYGGGSHRTGIGGVYGTTKSAGEVFDLLKDAPGTTPGGHGFGALGLADQDIEDLAAFVTTLLIDASLYIDGSKKFIGDPVAGGAHFADDGGCIICHGADGRALNFGDEEEPEYVGTIAVDNPWELIHKVRFGQPASFPEMPSWTERGGSVQGVADIGRYIQDNLPTGPPTPPVGGDPIRGGLLYDKWWEVKGAAAPTGSHPLYPADGRYQGADSYRCKECHGWDYKGVDGAYGSGSHKTGIRGVFGTTLSDAEVFELLETDTGPNGHGFGALGLTAQDIQDLVRFVRTMVIDTSPYIGPDKKFRGDATRGEAAFLGNGACHVCHGEDGAALNFGTAEEPEWVGTIAVDNPWELLHKVRVGQPGSVPTMPSWSANGGTDQGAADIGRYAAETLRTGVQSGDLAVEKGVARRTRRGTWKLKGRASYRPELASEYVGNLSDVRVEVDGVVYFDGEASGTQVRVKRESRSGVVRAFAMKNATGNLTVNLAKQRLVLALRGLAADRFDPSDGVDVTVHLASSRASVTSPVVFRGADRGVLEPASSR
jgi:thiosulfate dehydrogenase